MVSNFKNRYGYSLLEARMLRNCLFFVFLTIVFTGNLFSNESVRFTLEISGVMVNGGKVYLDIFSNERDFRSNHSSFQIVLDSSSQSIIHSFDLQAGEYVFAIFQDTNNNGELDTNFFGFPIEPFVITNYRSGIPNFNRLKFSVNNNFSRMTVSFGE